MDRGVSNLVVLIADEITQHTGEIANKDLLISIQQDLSRCVARR